MVLRRDIGQEQFIPERCAHCPDGAWPPDSRRVRTATAGGSRRTRNGLGAAFLLAVDGAFRRVHVRTTRSELSWVIGLGEQLRFNAINPSRFSSLASISVSKLMERRGQGRTAIPDFLRTDQETSSIETRAASEVLVARQAAVDRLPQQISDCCLAGVADMLVNQFSEPEPFVQFANQNQATVGSDVRSWKSTLRSPLKV